MFLWLFLPYNNTQMTYMLNNSISCADFAFHDSLFITHTYNFVFFSKVDRCKRTLLSYDEITTNKFIFIIFYLKKLLALLANDNTLELITSLLFDIGF